MGEQLRHYRLASKAAGDDVSLTRYIRISHNGPRSPKRQGTLPRIDAKFIHEGRTKFPYKLVQPVDAGNMLSSGHNSVKIGRDVRKPKFFGYMIYTLSLEERKTCPSSCLHWQSCYGNNMPLAKRVDHTGRRFLELLESEIAALMRKPWPGVLIRLHMLGDFYSVEYVDFWRSMLKKFPRLAIFGYTARNNEDPIGQAVIRLRTEQWERFAVRSSNGARHNMATVSIKDRSERPANAFICPEQTEQTACCATCGLCWSTRKNVAFLEH